MNCIEITEQTMAVEMLNMIVSSKGPVELDITFQGITFKVDSQLKAINNDPVKQQ